MTTQNSPSALTKGYLLNSAFGLLFVALAYGAVPQLSLPLLSDIDVASVDLTHVFRALMSVYIGILLLWVLGAFNLRYTRTAIITEIAFMGSLALGRTFSLIIDGIPSGFFVLCLVAEAVMALAGMVILKRVPADSANRPVGLG